jgi:hypothetical protein
MVLVKTRISIAKSKRGDLNISRNGTLELVVQGASPELHRVLVKMLQKEKDYDLYLKHYGIKDMHLGSWLLNVLASYQEDRWLLDEFQKVIVKIRGTKSEAKV